MPTNAITEARNEVMAAVFNDPCDLCIEEQNDCALQSILKTVPEASELLELYFERYVECGQCNPEIAAAVLKLMQAIGFGNKG